MDRLTNAQVEFSVAVLKTTIEQRKLSQKQMEELSGVPQPTISKILSRTAPPTYDVLSKLLQSVGLTFRTILFDSDGSSHDMLGYLATPLTGVVADKHAETQLNMIVQSIKNVASQFQAPEMRLYWPGDHTHPSRNPDFSASQVYLTDRSRASTHDFIILFCGSPSYGVGQENEIATQAGLPAIRLIPRGISRMMGGSFINSIDVEYKGTLASKVDFDLDVLHDAFDQVKKLHFRHLAFFGQLNGSSFAEKLRRLVDERLGDYKSFADDLGIGLSYLHALMDENSVVSNPSLRLLRRMASRLGTTIGFLIGESDQADPIWAASHASWRNWIEGSNIGAKVAIDLRDEWRHEYQTERTSQSTASFRKQNKAMSVADWDARKVKRGKVNAGPGLF